MDLIIVVVFIVVLHVSCSFTKHIVFLPPLHSVRKRETTNFRYLDLIRQPFTSVSLSLSLSTMLNRTMSFFFFSLCASLRQSHS